ncbi:MAG: hypothetical protein KDA37_16520, partial [Planctomycetales bacterium]|nr:hypothetical protein [Planctomycetales bacterium]
PSFQRHLRQDNRGSELSPTGSDASGLPTPGDGKGNAESAGPTDSQSMTLQGLDAEGLAALRAEQSSAPLTTQVIDHRSRTRRFSSNYASPTADSKESDIRAGRWIESKPRIQPH